MKYVKCYPSSKIPAGDAWQTLAMSEEKMLAEQAIHPRANWGLLLGPVSNTTDIECDSPEATETYRKLFLDVRTPAWASKRGSHHLHEYDPHLADLPGVVKYQGLRTP